MMLLVKAKKTFVGIAVACVLLMYTHHALRVRRFAVEQDLLEDLDQEANILTTDENHKITEPFKAPVKFVLHESVDLAEERLNSGEPRSPQRPRQRRNVLFMMADDMRAQLSPYHGPDSEHIKPKLHTPNFERLAAKSLFLKKAFVQYTFCGPSRTSMLTSRRPDITGIYNNNKHWRYERGNYTSLPQYFKLNGYVVQGIGKVFHPGVSSSNDDPVSWTEPYKHGGISETHYLKPYGPGERWIEVPPNEEEANPLPDKVNIQSAKEFLEAAAEKAKSGEKPFFLGFGFYKPHVSFICPQKYYNMYPKEEEENFLPDPLWQMPLFRPGSGIINGTAVNESWSVLPTETLRHIRQAYFACISYVDDLLGELLATLKELDLADNTVVSFVADHGYHLGEQRMVGKQTLFDSSSHVPMMIQIPGRTDHGIVSKTIVQGLDVFPTIVEAAGLDPIPPCRSDSVDIPLCTEGTSLLPLIDDPDLEIRPHATTQQLESDDRMRFSIRTERFRYTQSFWRELNIGPTTYRPVEPGSPYYLIELFDHKKDRQERFNVADDPKYAKIRAELQKALYETIDVKDE